MDVDAEASVVGQVPPCVVGVVIDDDVVLVPIPIVNVAEIERSYAEVKSVKPETVRATAAQAPDVARSEPAFEAAVRPGAIEVKAGIVTANGVSDPLTVVVNVRGLRMTLAVAICRARWSLAGCVTAIGRRTMLRNVSSANALAAAGMLSTASVAAASMLAMLRPQRQG